MRARSVLVVSVALSLCSSYGLAAEDGAALLDAARTAETALLANESKLRLRHNSEALIRRWQRAAKAGGAENRKSAVEGELRAWKRLAHWSGHKKDAARVRTLEASLRQEKTAQRPQLLRSVRLEQDGGGFALRLGLSDGVKVARHRIPGTDSRGPRVYFDISPVHALRSVMKSYKVADADVQRIRVGQRSKNAIRVVVDFALGGSPLENVRWAPGRNPALRASREPVKVEPTPPVAKMEHATTLDLRADAELRAIVAELRRDGAALAKKAEEKLREAAKTARVEAEKLATREPTRRARKASKPKPKARAKPAKGPRHARERAPARESDLFAVQRVVIDAGHGGKDHGACGADGLKEKHVNLSVARRLARLLRDEMGVEVRLTRSDDRFVSLKRRVEIANAAGADLFISIHANGHQDSRVHGVETYHLDTSRGRRLRARSGAVGTVDRIIADMSAKSAAEESRRLAAHVQNALVGNLRQSRSELRDLGVKQAGFYVLSGAKMPAVLVETGFITHPRESRRLADPRYQQRISTAIAKGMKRFVRERSQVASRM